MGAPRSRPPKGPRGNRGNAVHGSGPEPGDLGQLVPAAPAGGGGLPGVRRLAGPRMPRPAGSLAGGDRPGAGNPPGGPAVPGVRPVLNAPGAGFGRGDRRPAAAAAVVVHHLPADPPDRRAGEPPVSGAVRVAGRRGRIRSPTVAWG